MAGVAGRDGASDVAHDYVTQAEGLDGMDEGLPGTDWEGDSMIGL